MAQPEPSALVPIFVVDVAFVSNDIGAVGKHSAGEPVVLLAFACSERGSTVCGGLIPTAHLRKEGSRRAAGRNTD